tara:strand:+ start:491 stop:712 length:222 start_codon:yes stop_codon:yes gene_type:complete
MSEKSVNLSSYSKNIIHWPPKIKNIILSNQYSNHINNNPPAYFACNSWNITIDSKLYKYKYRVFAENKWIYYN